MNSIADAFASAIGAGFHAAQTGTVWVGVGLVLAVSALVLASERSES